MDENLKNVDQGNKASKEKYLEYDSIIYKVEDRQN